MDKDDDKMKIHIGLVFAFILGILICAVVVQCVLTQTDTSSETFNGSCTVITSDKTYEDCFIIEDDKESDFVEFKCDGKDICVHGQYTIIKEGE